MSLSPALLEILACPRCHGPLAVGVDESALLCNACRLRYPVREGIPVLLLDEAERTDA